MFICHKNIWEDSVPFTHRVIRSIDYITEYLGRITAWLVLGCVVTCFLVAFLRYVFSIGYVWMQELYVWQHALVFMLGAGYTLLHDGHVRVDVFYSKLSPKGQALVQIIGTCFFLWPWLFVVSFYGWSFIKSSWQILEESPQTDGLPGYFLLKSVIYVFCFVIFLQSFAHILRSLVLIFRGYEVPRFVASEIIGQGK